MTDGLSTAISVEFSLNRRTVAITVQPHDVMLDVLRDQLGLTGAKRSCDMQICGTCTILLDGEPVSSCTTLACELDGRKVETVEGLASDEALHPVQQAFVDHGALQCGFCTPGMIMSAKALLDEQATPSRSEIVEYLNGNLCRCTGYFKIIEAVQDAAGRLSGSREAATSEGT